MAGKIEVIEDAPMLAHDELARRIDQLPPHQRREALRAASQIYNKQARVWRTPEADALEAKGWELWLTTLAPHVFHSQFEDFDREFWDWYWLLLMTKKAGKRLVDLNIELSYLYTLARGLGKSSSLEWAFIALGAVLGRVLGVYVSSTSGLAEGHLNNIRDELEAPTIEDYYPGLANPEVGKFGNRYGWTAALLATASGLTIFAAGLQEEIRGLKRRNLRPALLGLDEFDSKNDSPDIVVKKEGIIGGSIFGTQTTETIIVAAQNIIHKGSVADRTQKRRNELLSYRKESGLIRAFSDDLEIEMVGTRWFATKGHPLYARLDMAAFQKFLDTSGPIETYAEYQHRFDLDLEGKVFKNYNDLIQVITEEDFARVYHTNRPPSTWYKYVAHDKARTKTEYHANVALTASMSSQNTPLPGITFLYDFLSFPAASEPEDCAVEMLKCMSPTIRVTGVTYQWSDLVKTIISRNDIAKFTRTRREEIKAQREGLAQIIPEHVHPLLVSLNYQLFRMSHEADDWRAVYRDAFGLPFVASNPGHTGGTAMINLVSKIDYDVPDPFGRRVYDEEGHDVGPMMGMSRLYLIVKKDKLPYPNDAKPDLLHGSDLARYQFTEQRYLESKQTKTGEAEGEPEKRNDDFFNCLVGDTPILTKSGERPIKDVVVGEQVWTRVGWKSVIASAQTSLAAQTYIVELSDGRILQGTANHPVWVDGKGWVGLGMLSYDDIIYSCPEDEAHEHRESSLNSTVPDSIGIPTPNTRHIEGISSRTLRIGGVAFRRFTLKYGNRFMERCRKGRKFTTKITTLSITNWIISNLDLKESTSVITKIFARAILSSWQRCRHILTQSDISLMRGTQLQKGENGIASILRELNFSDGIPRRVNMSTVEFNLWPLKTVPAFALSNALNEAETGFAWNRRRALASSVEIHSRPAILATKYVGRLAMHGSIADLRFARSPVRDVEPHSPLLVSARNTAQPFVVKRPRKSGIMPVYNLEVEDQPEYFANGILVHNCLQMLYHDHAVQARELTSAEAQDAALPLPLQAAAIEAEVNPEKKASNVMARQIAIRREAAQQSVNRELAGGKTGRKRLSSYRSLMKKAQ